MVEQQYIRRQRYFDPHYAERKPMWHIAITKGSHEALCGFKISLLEEPRRARKITQNLCFKCQQVRQKSLEHDIEIANATGDLYEI